MTATRRVNLAQLRTQIHEARLAYHNGDEPVMSDAAYDALVEQLRAACPNDPLLSQVGAPVDGALRAKVPHEAFFGSLNAIHDVTAFGKWCDTYGRTDLVVSPKYDGLTLVLYYAGGRLLRAVTRGDGRVGEDVTQNAIRIPSVVAKVKHMAFTGWVRGEVVLTVEDWRRLDPDLSSNPRNLAAGALRRDDGGDRCQYLSFFAFDTSLRTAATYAAQCTQLREWGFQLPDQWPGQSMAEVVKFHQTWQRLRDEDAWRYWADGVVVRVNELDVFASVGSVGGCPRAAVAWKFAPHRVQTVLRGVDWQVGRTGRLTPVARLKPVKIGGVEVSNASLHNPQQIKRLQIAVGDTVSVVRAGDVIPQVEAVVSRSKGVRGIIRPPESVDGVKVQCREVPGGGVEYYVESHPQIRFRSLLHWVRTLDIKGAGEEIIAAAQAAARFPVEDISDMYALPGEEWASLLVNGRAVGASRGAAIAAAFQAARKVPLHLFIAALGVRHLGVDRVQAIIRKAAPFKVLQDVSSWFPRSDWAHPLEAYASPLGVPGIASEAVAELRDKAGEVLAVRQFVDVLPAEPEVGGEVVDGPLKGKVFVLTGAMSKSREEITADIVAMGGRVADRIAKGVDYLVQASPDSSSRKSIDAQKRGVAIIGEVDLYGMMQA